MANLTDDLKNALSSAVSGAGDVAGTVQRVTKDNVVSLLQGAGGVATASLQTVDQVVAEGLQAIISTGASLTDGVPGLIRGVVGGAKDTGVNVVEAAARIKNFSYSRDDGSLYWEDVQGIWQVKL